MRFTKYNFYVTSRPPKGCFLLARSVLSASNADSVSNHNERALQLRTCLSARGTLRAPRVSKSTNSGWLMVIKEKIFEGFENIRFKKSMLDYPI